MRAPASRVRDAIDTAEVAPPPRAPLDADAIMGTTARLFGLEVDVLWGPSRAPLHIDARAVAMLLVRGHAGLGWAGISDLFRRDASTCLRTVVKALDEPQRLAWAKAVLANLDERREAP